MKVNKYIPTYFALAMALLLGQQTALAADAFHWPNGARAAVSLGYDDAIDSQLDHAIPTLDKYQLKGTFYLQLSNPAVGKRMAEWRSAAKNGHELGNHSLFHQCSRSAADRDWVQVNRDLDTTSVAQMKDQVLVANTMLTAIDGKRERTYTVPCGDLKAGGASSYVPAIVSEFVAIKAGGQIVTATPTTLDPRITMVTAPVGLSGQQLIAMVKDAADKGGMIAFTFHGIGGDYLTTSAEAHEELVKYLAQNKQLYWTDTLLDIMTYVKQQK